jgi:hypothetical protein
VHFAREGADVAIVYLDEHKDADETAALVEKEGRKCLKFAGDVGKPEVRRQCRQQMRYAWEILLMSERCMLSGWATGVPDCMHLNTCCCCCLLSALLCADCQGRGIQGGAGAGPRGRAGQQRV